MKIMQVMVTKLIVTITTMIIKINSDKSLQLRALYRMNPLHSMRLLRASIVEGRFKGIIPSCDGYNADTPVAYLKLSVNTNTTAVLISTWSN